MQTPPRCAGVNRKLDELLYKFLGIRLRYQPDRVFWCSLSTAACAQANLDSSQGGTSTVTRRAPDKKAAVVKYAYRHVPVGKRLGHAGLRA